MLFQQWKVSSGDLKSSLWRMIMRWKVICFAAYVRGFVIWNLIKNIWKFQESIFDLHFISNMLLAHVYFPLTAVNIFFWGVRIWTLWNINCILQSIWFEKSIIYSWVCTHHTLIIKMNLNRFPDLKLKLKINNSNQCHIPYKEYKLRLGQTRTPDDSRGA